MKELSTLCEAGDQEFVVDHTSSLTAHTERLKEETGNRKDLLESRMESWRVFPVEAAAEVQDFLEKVSQEIEDEDDFDNCSADELMKKLERLEVGKPRLSERCSHNSCSCIFCVLNCK